MWLFVFVLEVFGEDECAQATVIIVADYGGAIRAQLGLFEEGMVVLAVSS